MTNGKFINNEKIRNKDIKKDSITIISKNKNNDFVKTENVSDLNYKYNDYELNNLSYEEAKRIDKRTYFQYYFGLLKRKQLIIFTFLTNSDYNSRLLKISLFLFSFVLYITINALFFNDSTMHKIYEDYGAFNFIYQLPQIVYVFSSVFTSVLSSVFSSVFSSEDSSLSLEKL